MAATVIPPPPDAEIASPPDVVPGARGDFVSRAKSWLTAEPPAGSRTMFGETDMPGRIVRAAGDLFIPGTVPDAARTAATLPIGGGLVTGPLMRVGAGALAGGAARAAQTGDLKEGVAEGSKSGLSQFAGELLPGALRFGLTQRAAAPLLKARADKTAHDAALHEAVTTTEREAHARAVTERAAADTAKAGEARAAHTELERGLKREHAEAEAAQTRAHRDAVEATKRVNAEQKARHAAEVEQVRAAHARVMDASEAGGATTIAQAFKEKVPAWSDFPSTTRGLLDMVYGKGQRLLSDKFDASLKDVVRTASGQRVTIRADDAYALKVPSMGVPGMEARGAKVQMDVPEGMPPQVVVDAGQLALAATGQWKRNPGLYRRVVGALDEANIGDPAARAEYKAGQALIQFADKTQMLKGERFNADAAFAGFTKLKHVDELRRRGAGDIFEGPVADAVRAGRPAEPALPREPSPFPAPRERAPIPDPTVPAYRAPKPSPPVPEPARRVAPGDAPMPGGVKTRHTPNISFWEGAALAEIPFLVGGLVTGHAHFTGYGLPAAAGGLAARTLRNREFATQAPLTPAARRALDMLPPAMAQEAASLTRRGD